MRLESGILVLLMASFCVIQRSSDFKPATSNVLDAQYQKVDSNSRGAKIRFKAPDASKVGVNFWSGPRTDMGEAARWVLDVYNPADGSGELHYYTIIVDCAEVSDPGSTAYFGGSKWASAVEVPEAGADYYLPKDVPHGQVREIWYHSERDGDVAARRLSTCRLTMTLQRHAIRFTTCNTAEGRTRAAGYGKGQGQFHPRQPDRQRNHEANDYRDGRTVMPPVRAMLFPI